jgi:hypothetical protein
MLLSLLLACNDYGINEKLTANPIIAPDFIDFGHLKSGHESGLRQIIFSNGGELPLEVDYIQIHGTRFDVDVNGFTVDPDSWHALDLTYTPETYEFNEGYLDVYLKGQEDPVSSVWFQGHGDAPVIQVSPVEHDFGPLSEDCDISKEFDITNVGNIDLTVERINELSTIPQQISVNLGTLPPLPWTLSPQARISFWTEFLAEGLSLHSLEIKIDSNDPQEPAKSIIATGETMISTTMIESYIQGSMIFVDIIWVVDNSGSMNTFQNRLSSNIGDFINLFMNYSPDFQMAFITTDNSGFINGTYFTQNTPDLVVEAQSLVNSIGTAGSAHEQGLMILDEALVSNAGWFRPGAQLVAIFVTDEDDWSPFPPSSYAASYDLHYPMGLFHPYGIIGDIPSGCSGAWPGWAYYDLIQHYGSQWWSICEEDWGVQMEDIALSIVNSSAYTLDHPSPKIDSIRVFVNGQEVERGWAYGEDSNSIYFDFEAVPDNGDTVEVTYEIWECE